MNWPIPATCVLIGFGTAMLLIPMIIRWRASAGAPTVGTFHHTHKTPVSRLGGIAFAAAFIIVALLALIWFPVEGERLQTRLVVIGGALSMFLLGLRDDFKPLGAKKKLIGQILIAAAVCYCGVQIQTFQNPFSGVAYPLGFWAWPVTILWLLAMTNMINLIDGIDGLAGGISLMLMALLTYVGFQGELAMPAFVAATMCGALVGFLRYNFPPAKIYMGDGGAYFLGFLIGILTLVNSQKGTVVAALIAPLFALALPILDTSLAIVRRGLHGLPIFRPDRSHIHHKLMELGYSRRNTVLVLYGVSSVLLLLAFGAFWSQGRWAAILFGFVCLTLLLAGRVFEFGKNWFAVGEALGRSAELRRESQYALAVARWLELEGERVQSVEELWSNFTFMAGKMGFTSVTLQLSDGTREWSSNRDIAPETRSCRTHEFGGSEAMRLELCGDLSAMSPKLFGHLCELMAEAWSQGATRWQAKSALPIRFDSRIIERPAPQLSAEKPSPVETIKGGVAESA